MGGWGSVKASEFRRGDENRPQRWILASSRVDGTAVPGSLSEGAAERSEAEGVSFDGCAGPLVYHAAPLALKFLSSYVHRGTLPQSRPLGVPAPSGREPEWVRTIQPGTCETARFRAIFIAPTKALVILPFTIHRGTLPQSALAGCQLPQGGSREAVNYFRRFAISFPSKLKVTSVSLWVRL